MHTHLYIHILLRYGKHIKCINCNKNYKKINKINEETTLTEAIGPLAIKLIVFLLSLLRLKHVRAI